MNKNNQKEIINISNLNKDIIKNEQLKLEDKINIRNISEDKNIKKDILPKITLIKENKENNMLNQKREREISSRGNKENEEEDKVLNNNNNALGNKKRILVNEAKKEMKDFELLILNTEKEIQKKYGIVFPDLSFEDNFPDFIKNQLIDDFLESPNIKKILNEAIASKNNN
jgi:flagellar biosynthesis component FlhA